MELPLYELKINPDADSFVSAVALVADPAIEADFLAFNKVKELVFATDDERMELLGPAMVPNQRIFRRDKEGKEYNVFFSEATIRQVAQVFFEKGFQKNLNLDHTDTNAHTTIYQSYLVDSAKGMTAPKGMEDLPDGTWIIGAKIHDEKVWKSIKEGKRKGFSVEGFFEFFIAQHKDEDAEVLEALRTLNKLLDKIK